MNHQERQRASDHDLLIEIAAQVEEIKNNHLDSIYCRLGRLEKWVISGMVTISGMVGTLTGLGIKLVFFG